MHNRWHPDIALAVTVAAGDAVTLETEDGLAGQLTRASTHADCAQLDLGLGHPLAGPVEVTRSSSSGTAPPTSESPR